MSFRERTRRYWIEVANNQCQYESYDEQVGWQTCGKPAKEVHHIIGERETLEAGNDPDCNIALPLCRQHHTGNISKEEHGHDFAFHPDIGRARREYREWKQQAQHMAEITGGKIDYSTSPFAEAAREHGEAIRNGDRYIAGTEEIDRHYIDKMLALQMAYNAKNEVVRKPMKPHPDYDPEKKKRWYDGLF